MKKNIEYDLIIVILVIFLAVLSFAVKNDAFSNIDTTKPVEKELIAKKEYSNYAWTRVRHGYGFFSDGSIYYFEFDEDDYKSYKKVSNKKEYTDYILNNGHSVRNGMIKNDVDILLNSIDKLNEDDKDFYRNCRGADMGSTIYSVFKGTEEIVLKETGDCDGYSKSYNSRTILDIIEKNIPRY